MFDRKAYKQRPEVKQRYQEQAHNRRLWHKERNRLDKIRILMHYSNPIGAIVCNNCGEHDIDVLCIDHINEGGNEHRKTIYAMSNNFYSWLIKNDYPEGYQVLCANCNMKKSAYKL